MKKIISKIILLILTIVIGISKNYACDKSFELLSWNIQTFGNINKTRKELAKEAYASVISTSIYVMAIQEIANNTGLNNFISLLPYNTYWQYSFEDTPDSQDNGIFFRIDKATLTAHGFLTGKLKNGDTIIVNTKHPTRWAHVKVDDFDFVLISLHLTFKSGDANASKKELFAVLDWLADYLKSDKHDPDVIIAGDFNLPSRKGKTASKRGASDKWFAIEDIIEEHKFFSHKENKLIVLVDEPTSRPKKHPANNYDHFILTKSAYNYLINVERINPELVDKIDINSKSMVSDHYPIKAVFCIKSTAKEKINKE